MNKDKQKIKEIKGWIKEYNIPFVDCSNNLSLLIEHYHNKDNVILVGFIHGNNFDKKLKNYINMYLKYNDVIHDDSLLNYAIFSYKNTTKVIKDFHLFRKQSLDKFINNIKDCPICMNDDCDEFVNCIDCSYKICKSCYYKINECPICRKNYLNEYIEKVLNERI